MAVNGGVDLDLMVSLRALDAIKLRDVLKGRAAPSVNAMLPAKPGHAPLHVVCAQAVALHADASLLKVPQDAAARCAQELIDAGAAVNARNAEGETPIMIAIRSHDILLIEVLMKAGARPDLESPTDGINAFHVAAREGDGRVLRTLLRFGGEVEVDGVRASAHQIGTPMQLAAMLGKLDVVAVIHDHVVRLRQDVKKQDAVVDAELLAADGLDLPSGLDEASGALWLAVAHGQVEVVRYLSRQSTSFTTKAEQDQQHILAFVAAHGADTAVAAIDALEAEPRARTKLAALRASQGEQYGTMVIDKAASRGNDKLSKRLDALMSNESKLRAFDHRRAPAAGAPGVK